MKIRIPTDLPEKDRHERDLKPDYAGIVEDRLDDFQATLDRGLNQLDQVQLAPAAKEFRKLATDLKHLS